MMDMAGRPIVPGHEAANILDIEYRRFPCIWGGQYKRSLFSRYIILIMSTPYAHILWRSFFRKSLTQYQGAGRKAYIHRSDSAVYESAQRDRHMPVDEDL